MKLAEMQSRPATLAFTSRCDARHLATLALMWQSRGELPRSISELVRLSLETFTEVLVTSGQISLVPTQEEAQEILASMGILGKGIQRKNLISALTKEGSLTSLNSQAFKTSGRLAHDAPDIKEAVRQLEESLRDPNEFLQDKLKGDLDIKNILGSIGESPKEES